MAPKKTIYVKEADEPTWKRAEELAGESISSVLAGLLRDYVERMEKEAQQPEGRQVVRVKLEDGSIVKKAFMGSWVVEGFEDHRFGIVWDVALTSKGNVVICCHGGDKVYDVFASYDSLADAASSTDAPGELLGVAGEAIGEDFVEELDI